jgi:hypothetical protein
VRAIGTLLLLVSLTSGCWHSGALPPASSPIANDRLLDAPDPPALPSSVGNIAGYRTAAGDNFQEFAPPAESTSPADSAVLPLGDPEHFVDAPRAGAAPGFQDAAGSLPKLPGDAGQGIAGPTSEGGETGDGSPRAHVGAILAFTWDDSLHDYGNYYSGRTALEFAAVLAPAAVFANTNLDANFGNWYQTHVRSAETDHAADFFRPLGDGFYTIPVYVSAKFLGEYFDDVPGMSLLGEWGDRTSRALLVGAPPLLAVQYGLGAGRPAEVDDSYWRPFQGSHGASGHSFMGAVPFITLAEMTDDPLEKCFFFACSPWAGMSRINDNVHYLSQVWLGWWLAYLACDSVNRTESQKGPLVLSPLVSPEMTGVGVVYAH